MRWGMMGIRGGTVLLARMPLWISEVSRAGNQVTLQWQGGSGRYQVLARTNLTVGQWENWGRPATHGTAAFACSNATFFRVQSLTNP